MLGFYSQLRKDRRTELMYPMLMATVETKMALVATTTTTVTIEGEIVIKIVREAVTAITEITIRAIVGKDPESIDLITKEPIMVLIVKDNRLTPPIQAMSHHHNRLL